MEIEIIDWVIVGLLVFALFGLNTAVSAVMDIREDTRQLKADLKDIERTLERLKSDQIYRGEVT